MTYLELNKRCWKVFPSEAGDRYQQIYFVGNTAVVQLEKVDPYCTCSVDATLIQDMSSRPTAMDYLKGKRDNFID